MAGFSSDATRRSTDQRPLTSRFYITSRTAETGHAQEKVQYTHGGLRCR